MDNEIYLNAIEIYKNECKNFINKNKIYNDYISEISEKDIENIIILYASLQFDEEELLVINKVLNQDIKSKAEYIINNIEKILTTHIEAMPEELFEDIKIIVKNKGYIEVDFHDMDLSINHIILLKKLGFLFVNIEENTVKIHMPDVVLKTINELNDEKLRQINTEKKNVLKFIQGLLNAYGMIPITEAYVLYVELNNEILPETFHKYIFFASNILHTKFKSDEIYLYNINLLEEEIPELQEFHANNEYSYYTQKEIELLAENNYYVEYMQYKELKRFVEENVNTNIEIIKKELIDWYIAIAQMDESDAEDFLNVKINELNIENKYKEQLKEYIREIFEICPKWKLKGEIKRRRNSEIKILKFPNNNV